MRTETFADQVQKGDILSYDYPLDRFGEWFSGKAPSVINLDYPNLLKLFPQYRAKGRYDSAAFLMWYLENYYRLEEVESINSVCDKENDKGIDGIVVNDNDMTITVFQSRIRKEQKARIGDKELREFAGTLTQFESVECVQNLLDTAADKVVKLLVSTDVLTKILTHDVKGEFVTNADTDANGDDFLKTAINITFVGKTALTDTYISNQRDRPVYTEISFDIDGFQPNIYTVDSTTRTYIAPIKAAELVKMEGISNQSLFSFNIRGPLKNTDINRDIQLSVQTPKLHKLFPLFHNGITIVAATTVLTAKRLTIGGYFVVNGCQSLTTLYSNRVYITDDLRILVKVIQLEPTSDLAVKITEYSNVQNAFLARDFKANDKMQIRLQKEFEQKYPNFFYEIKRGETPAIGQTGISNEIAGLLLMAFDLKEPWATHRRYQIFEDKHSAIFGRKEVTADRIMFLWEIHQGIERSLEKIQNELVRKYKLIQYVMVYIIRDIFEKDKLAPKLLHEPELFVRELNDRTKFSSCVDRIIHDIVDDINGELKDKGEDFDYRNKLRDEKWIKDLSKSIGTTREKLVRRGNITTFEQDWNTGPPSQPW